MVINKALKLDYASVIFVDPGVQIDETLLNSLTTVVARHTHGLWRFTSELSTQNMPLCYSTCVSQGSVETRLRCGGIFNDTYCKLSTEWASKKI